MDLFYPLSKLFGFVSAPSNALILLTVLGTLILRGRLGRRVAGTAAVLLVIAGLSPLADLMISPLEQRFPPWDASRGAPDGVIVLGGALDGGAFGTRGDIALNEAAERVTEAVALARAYPHARIIFSGGEGGPLPLGFAEADAARAFFLRMGLPPGRVEFETASRNTAENAVFTKALVAPQPGQRWLLVTSAWHMPRAVGCFRAAGFEVEAYPVDVRSSGPKALWPFFYASEGLRRLDVATREWIGLIGYALTGRTTTLFPAP